MTAQEVVNEINGYIQRNGGIYSAWYVGIAADPQDRLFNNHCVKRDQDLWIYRPCLNSSDARLVEKHFLDRLGTSGGSGGGDYNTSAVYAYKIAPHTFESA